MRAAKVATRWAELFRRGGSGDPCLQLEYVLVSRVLEEIESTAFLSDVENACRHTIDFVMVPVVKIPFPL